MSFDLDACILPSLEQEEEYIRSRSPTGEMNSFWSFIVPTSEHSSSLEESATSPVDLTSYEGLIRDLAVHYRLGRECSLIDEWQQ